VGVAAVLVALAAVLVALATALQLISTAMAKGGTEQHEGLTVLAVWPAALVTTLIAMAMRSKHLK
jgi:hypothetical protein